MLYIMKSNKTSLDILNKKINDWMYNNIEGYNAVRWGKIYKHPTQNKYALEIKEDSRNPLSALTDNERAEIIEPELSDDWYITDQDGLKHLIIDKS